MPAVSQAQANFFRWAEHNPEQVAAEGKVVGMSHQQMHDFSATPSRDLPKRVGRYRSNESK